MRTVAKGAKLLIFIAFFVCALAANEDSLSKVIESSQKSDKLKEDVLQSIPTSYEFKYSTGQEGPSQASLFREEYRDHDGTVKGKYGYIDPYGKLRVVHYKAGAGGYTASGDIGPDSAAQNEAQLAFRNDPSVRAQTDAWNRGQSGNFGTNNWNSPPLGYSSVDPLWNVGALPKTPNYQPVQQAQPIAPSPQPLPPRVSADKNRIWDEKVQKSWDNSNNNNNNNNRQNNDLRSGGGIDWNTWNANQQSWTKQTRSGAQQWTSNINHNWPGSAGNGASPPSDQWSNQAPVRPQTQAGSLWTPPSQGPTSGQWSQMPQNPTAGQWTQFDQNIGSNEWSQPVPASQPSPQTLPELKEKWTGIPSDAQRTPNEPEWDKPLAGPPATRPAPVNWNSQPPAQIQWGAPPPTTSIADQWSQRRNQQNPMPQINPIQGQFVGQSPNNWQSGVQYDSPSSSEWTQSPSKVARIGDQAISSPVKYDDQPAPSWQQPAQPNQARFEQPIAPTNIGSNQWSGNSAAGDAGENLFAGQPYVHFRIDHTVDSNQPPLRYQYSY